MTTPIQKYLGEQDPRYGGKLQWPGVKGYPFLGEVPPSLRQQEVDELPVCGNTHEDRFDLNDEVRRAEYNWVRDRIRNRLFAQDHIERQWPLDKEWPIIYLEWTQFFAALPQKSSSARNVTNASTTQFTLRRPD